MNYIRGISGSVSKTWNSINPSTLSGAIDVIVIEHEDGSLACSPFHVRFGKFSLLRPYEKKVEFRVNDVKQDYAMKLAEGGEAFFVFETSDNIPEAMQTSPLVSPASSPSLQASASNVSALSEPDFLDLDTSAGKARSASMSRPGTGVEPKALASRRPSHLSIFFGYGFGNRSNAQQAPLALYLRLQAFQQSALSQATGQVSNPYDTIATNFFHPLHEHISAMARK